jgi:hypothetical protein
MPTRRLPVALAAAAFLTLPAPALAGPITRNHVVSTAQLRPGVVFTHRTLSVRGYGKPQQLYTVSWQVGNPHLRLSAEPRGTYYPSDRSFVDSGIGAWARRTSPSGLVAAMTGDFSTPTGYWGNRSTVSGLYVHGRYVYSFGYGGDAVGYLANGDFMMAKPRAVATLISLPGGHSATIGLWNPASSAFDNLHGDQVAVYTAGHVAIVRKGYEAVTLASTVLDRSLRGDAVRINAHGLQQREHVRAYSISEPTHPLQRLAMTMRAVRGCGGVLCKGYTTISVPSGRVVVVARAASLAGHGLATLAARSAPALTASVSSAAWDAVDDIMGGKPQLVRNGVPVTRRPADVDPWQWTCAGGCWRTALIRTASGQASLVVGGASYGDGVTMPVWAAMLQQLGARQALGFDANGSAELYRPGAPPIDGFAWERPLPTLTALSYH